jgi:hypothetical protein
VVVAAGVTVIELPVPARVVPHPPVYHFQLAPVPKLPPLTVKVELEPGHKVVEVALTEDAAVEFV